MQIFPCPFCGNRSEQEFHYEGQAGKLRPAVSKNASDKDWASYLYDYDNPKGATSEIWLHIPCQLYFEMARDTVTMEVLGVKTLKRGRQ